MFSMIFSSLSGNPYILFCPAFIPAEKPTVCLLKLLCLLQVSSVRDWQ